MMALCDVHLHRREVTEPWGFSMVGGRDQHKPLTVSKVRRSSPAEGQLEEGEEIMKIDETRADHLYHHHAVGLMKNTGLYLKLTINRSSMSTMSSVPVWKPVRAPTQDLVHTRVQQEQHQVPPIFLYHSVQDNKIPVNVSQLQTISHHKPLPASLHRPTSPVYQFPALPPESCHLHSPLPSPRAASPVSPNNQSASSYRRVTAHPSGSLIGQQLPLTVFYSTPDVAFVGNPVGVYEDGGRESPPGVHHQRGHNCLPLQDSTPDRPSQEEGTRPLHHDEGVSIKNPT